MYIWNKMIIINDIVVNWLQFLLLKNFIKMNNVEVLTVEQRPRITHLCY